jgi:uncharacterized protein YndB with AHSA1/START domain
MFDLLQQLQAIYREVRRHPGDAGELVTLQLRRTYDFPIADVWSALTDAARLARWLYPVSGDLRAGGSFQFEGNAGGDILACEPPHRLRVTYGGPTSLVEVRLTARGTATDLLLEHAVPIEIARSAAGALFVGPGWDTAIAALDLHLRDALPDAAAFHASREVQELGAQSIDAWTATVTASGGATADEIAGVRAAALAHFAPGRDVMIA